MPRRTGTAAGALPDLRRNADLTAPLISVTSPEWGAGVPAVSRRAATHPPVDIATQCISVLEGPHKPSNANDEAQARNALSPGLFCRDDRI